MNVTTALQVNATSGNGITALVLPERRLVTFNIAGNGNVTAGAVTLESSPVATPIDMVSGAPESGSGGTMVWTALTTITVPAKATTDYVAGWVSGTLRARISTLVAGGTVTVLAIRDEEERGWSRPS